jgi:hypothetical protein
MEKNCKHCGQIFKARRKNHAYCCTSCKTLASYKRNQYKYVPGHYRVNPESELEKSKSVISKEISDELVALNEKINKLVQNQKNTNTNFDTILNVIAANVIVDTTIYGAKKMFKPSALHATKGDIQKLSDAINEIKNKSNNLDLNTDYLTY